MRLIDADALWMDVIHSMDYCDDILEIIERQPTVEPILEEDGMSRLINADELTGGKWIGTETDKIDEVINNIEYAIEVLKEYRKIQESGTCNDCNFAHGCSHEPKLGKLVRFNCPFYEREVQDGLSEM